MRVKFPAFAFLSLSLILGLGASVCADTNGVAPDIGTILSRLTPVSCSTGNTAIPPTTDSVTAAPLYQCRFTGQVYCQNWAATGCEPFLGGQANSNAPFVTKLAEAPDLNTFKQTAAQDRQSADTALSQAKLCCQDFTGCPMPQEAVDALSDFKSITPKSDGPLQATDKSSESTAQLMKVTAGVAGACDAYKSACLGRFGVLKDAASHAKCKSAPGDTGCASEAGTTAAQFQAQINICKGFSSQTASQQASRFAEASAKAADSAKLQSVGGGRGGDSTATGGGSGSAATNGSGSGLGSGSMNPSMLAGLAQMAMGMMQQQSTASDPAAMPTPGDCSTNPALAGCTAAGATPGNWQTQSTGELQNSQGSDTTGFSSLGSSTGLQPASMVDASAGGKNPITTRGIAGGGGGGIPGAGNSTSASLGATGGSTTGQFGIQSKTTDILHGEGGHGGYSQVAAGMNMQPSDAGGGYSYGGGANNDSLGGGMHLADFLPGGKKDPARNLASVAPPAPQIQPKTVNIWSRISEHIRSRCAQGLLRDCGPQ